MMKSLASMMSVMTSAVFATAMADASPQASGQQPQVQIEVGADVVGDESVDTAKTRVVTKTLTVRVGPDGTIEMKDAPPDVTKKLADVRASAEKRAEDAHKAIDRLEQQAPNIAPGFGMQGSITIIGPDGVKHTKKFGDGDGPKINLQELIEDSLQAAGAELPEEARAKLKQALKQQGGMQMHILGGAQPKSDTAEISTKLDRILERLEKLEEDVGEMKAAKSEQK